MMKKRLRQLLQQQRYDEIADLAGRRRRVLGVLVSLTFDQDPLIGWRAVEATGAAADRIAEEEPAAVRDHLRRLHWLLSEESGGICWHAPEAMAEIVRRRPALFSDYVPIILSLIREMADEDLEHFRAGILWAIGRLGPVCAGQLNEVLPAVLACLDHPDPQVRGTAVWCLGQCGRADGLAGRDDLLADEGPVDLYEGGSLGRTTVCRLVRRAIGGRSAESR
jgi:hypothetical protein